MALSAKSLINYGIEVTSLNQNLDFVATSGGPTLTAVLDLGFYSPGGLAAEVALQLQSQDSVSVYSVTVERNILGGTQNRLTIATSGSFLSLLFLTGPHATTGCASLIGFNPTDYTGNTSYTGSTSTGTPLVPTYMGYNYLDTTNQAKVFGAVNISASGLKEAVTFNIQQFIEVEFKYEAKSRLVEWDAFFSWAIQQRQFDLTPEITSPDTSYTVTLESTQYDGQGLGFQMKELLPDFPNEYTTGPLKLRVIPSTGQFIS